MMKSSILIAAALAAAADASTTVAVLELGKGGAVRRTTAKHTETTVSGVNSFWSNLHDSGRKLQHAGMTIVPDLFNKADNGMVLGLMGSGVDLAAMPNLSGLVENEGAAHVVGHMTVEGANGAALLEKAGSAQEVAPASLVSTAKSSKSGLSAMSVSVTDNNAATVDTEVASLIEAMHKEAMDAGKTVILHLVVEEEDGASRRRRLSRRLEDEGDEDEDQEDENEDEDQDEDAEEGDEDGNNANANGNNGYYGYGYYNAYGEWVTPYKTMFQIQYFNVVLWTAVGLVIVLFFTIYLMINMPLMADTLLFGESAKMVGE